MTSSGKVSNKEIERLAAMRKRAEEDLDYFAHLVNPQRQYGEIHTEVFNWWTRPTAKLNQLLLLPRAHMKSHCAAVRAAWDVTRDPTVTILYLSATANLAESQLYSIKNIFTSDIYQLLWPEMINPEEGKRERWTTEKIIVDHPLRKAAGIRDCTIEVGGITKNITGLHADKIYLDDMIVPSNAYTEDGRTKVEAIYSQLASIKNPGASICVVGTRYHPRDLYDTLLKMEKAVVDETTGEIVDKEPIYEVMERVVEKEMVFLWPRQRAEDGKWYGFDINTLMHIKAEYIDATQYFAQYYNNPNDPSADRIRRDRFQYYDPKFVNMDNGYWYFKEKRLNVFAAVDFAFSVGKKSDFTAIVIIGVDSDNNIYVLAIDRFKTESIKTIFEHIAALYNTWQFRKLRAEVTVAQSMIVKELKESYIKPYGLMFSVDEYRPTKNEGNKQERIAATLEPRYDNMQMWHYRGGNCQLLEEELVLGNPPHDDIKDALTAAVDIAIAPVGNRMRSKKRGNVVFSNKFGGVAYK